MALFISNKDLPYTPFLVIGSGIAGLYTALKLSEIGEVTLVTKETLVESNTLMRKADHFRHQSYRFPGISLPRYHQSRGRTLPT